MDYKPATSSGELQERKAEPTHENDKFVVPVVTPTPYPAFNLPTPEQLTPKNRKSVHHCLVLLCCGLVLATGSGLIGGFLGRAIERANVTKPDIQTQNTTAPNPPPTCTTTFPTTATGSPIPTSTTFERLIPEPKSGCNQDDQYRTFRSVSQWINTPFTTICGQGWTGDDLNAMSVATQSDCVESCYNFNLYGLRGERRCVGAGFIPEWWNQTKAAGMRSGKPYNCYLKSNTTGIARNKEPYEVIALCLQGVCDGISG